MKKPYTAIVQIGAKKDFKNPLTNNDAMHRFLYTTIKTKF